MPNYFTPGVYVEEVDRGARPIQGVSTSVAGAVGVTVRGPTDGKPVLVTSFSDYTRTFGGFVPEPDAAIRNQWNSPKNEEGGYWWMFAHCVRAFFDNGGKQLFVKRVFSGGKFDPAQGKKAGGAVAAAAQTRRGFVAEVTKSAAAASTAVTLRHLFGIKTSAGGTVKFINGKTLQAVKWRKPDGTAGNENFTVTGYDPTAMTVQLDKPLHEPLSDARGDYAEIAAPAAGVTLTFAAKAKGAWGNNLQVRVRPMEQKSAPTLTLLANPGLDPTPVTTGIKTYTAAVAGPPAVAEFIEVNDEGLKVGDTVEIAGARYTLKAKAGAPVPVKQFEFAPAKPAGEDWANDKPAVRKIRRTNAHLACTMKAFTPAVAAAVGPPPVVAVAEFIEVNEDGLAVGDEVFIAGAKYTLAAKAGGAPRQFEFAPAKPAGENWANDKPAVRKAQADKKILVNGAGRALYEGAIVELDNRTTKEVLTVAAEPDGNEVTLSAVPQEPYFDGDTLRVIEAEVAIRVVRRTATGVEVEADETFQNLRLANDTKDLALVKIINERSALVTVKNDGGVVNALANFPLGKVLPWQNFGENGDPKGDDALAALTVDDFAGEDGGSGNRTGIAALEDITDISIVLTPGMWSRTVRDAAITHCESLKYRVLVQDPPPGLSIQGIREYRAPIDTKYAALYYPWVVVRDPVQARDVPCPPSAHMAGLWARIDGERGVQKAPANEVIRGITRLHQDVNAREQELLNPLGINALREFPNRGFRVWGGRTLSTTDQNFKYVNVRRIFNFIERSIDEGTQFVVFEPNDENLWSRVRQTVSNFLNTQWRAGLLEGKTADDAYFVACDRGVTMTQAEIENGMLICEIGIAPVYPAEFVIFRVQKYVSASKQTA